MDRKESNTDSADETDIADLMETNTEVTERTEAQRTVEWACAMLCVYYEIVCSLARFLYESDVTLFHSGKCLRGSQRRPYAY
jgi:hypothetical protein